MLISVALISPLYQVLTFEKRSKYKTDRVYSIFFFKKAKHYCKEQEKFQIFHEDFFFNFNDICKRAFWKIPGLL